MQTITLGVEGLTIDGVVLHLPTDLPTLSALLGLPGPEDRNLYGVRWPFPASELVALESLHSDQPATPIVQLSFRPAAFAGTFLVEGRPWRDMRFRKTQYGPEKRIGGWVVTTDDAGWVLYPEPRAKKKTPQLAAAKKPREVEERIPATKRPSLRRKRFDPTYPVVARKRLVRFVDRNFKLMVLEHLMFARKVLRPVFELEGFVATYEKRAIDLATEGYDAPIAEVLAWFENFPIDRKHVTGVRKLTQHPGAVIHGVYPQWTGEDDAFVIRSAEDAKHFPDLEELRLFSKSSAHDAKLRRAFSARGVTAHF